jgi:glutathione S-transferase
MEPVHIVILLTLIEYQVLTGLVARARGRYGVKAPAVTGSPEFERTFRVQQNTLEGLIAFIPAVWIFGRYVSPLWATVLGAVFIVARIVYAAGYIRAAGKRAVGAYLSGAVVAVLILGGLTGIVLKLW